MRDALLDDERSIEKDSEDEEVLVSTLLSESEVVAETVLVDVSVAERGGVAEAVAEKVMDTSKEEVAVKEPEIESVRVTVTLADPEGVLLSRSLANLLTDMDAASALGEAVLDCDTLFELEFSNVTDAEAL